MVVNRPALTRFQAPPSPLFFTIGLQGAASTLAPSPPPNDPLTSPLPLSILKLRHHGSLRRSSLPRIRPPQGGGKEGPGFAPLSWGILLAACSKVRRLQMISRPLRHPLPLGQVHPLPLRGRLLRFLLLPRLMDRVLRQRRLVHHRHRPSSPGWDHFAHRVRHPSSGLRLHCGHYPRMRAI